MAGIIIFLLALLCAYLALKIFLLRRGTDEMISDLRDILSDDTNIPITVSGGDRTLKKLANELNRELKELKRLRRKYKNGDREIKDAVTNISHDLRTPLTAICGYTELLRQEEHTEAAARYIENIQSRAEEMKKLTEELFRYSVILSTSDELASEPVDLAAALQESIAGFYEPLREKGITPKIEMTDEKVIRNLDRNAIFRVYGNILGNALKYSDGDLYISLDQSGRAVFKNSAKNLGGVDVGRLFDRFFSVEAAKNSTGLGLAISKSLTEHMGGTISADFSDGILSIEICF